MRRVSNLEPPGPDKIAVVKERENIRFKEEKKKRLKKKPRETVKKTEVA